MNKATCAYRIVLHPDHRSLHGALVIALLLLAALTRPMTAHAEGLLLDPSAAAECPDCTTPTGGAQVINYLEQLAPQDDVTLTPPDGATAPEGGWQGNASTMVADEGATTTATGAAADAADAVASSSVLAEEAAGAIPELCASAILCPVSLGIGAFGAGYVIGTGAKALYLKFYGGDAEWDDPLISGPTWHYWDGPGEFPVGGPNGPVIHVGEYYLNWVEDNPFGYNIFNYAWQGDVAPGQCRFGLPAPHSVLIRVGTSTLRCDQPSPIAVYLRTPEMFFSHKRPPAPAGSTSTPGATSVPAPSTPPRSSFKDGATSVLNDPKSTKLRLWLEHELSPRCHADPTKSLVNVPNPLPGESETSFEGCLTTLGLVPTAVELPDADLDADFGEPVWSNPGDEATVERGTEIRVYRNPPESRSKTKPDERCRPDDSIPAFDPGVEPPGYTGADPAFQPRPAPSLAGYPGFDVEAGVPRTIHLWWGGFTWGYRHIMVKHGYGPADEADTAAALLDDEPIPEDGDQPSTWLYMAFYNAVDPVTGTVQCARSVIVNFFHRDTEPDTRDIITSFYGSYQP